MDQQTLTMAALLGGLLLLSLLVTAAFLIRRKAVASIAGFSWFRKVLLEHYIWVQESSYSGFPEGSRNQHREVEHYQSSEVIRYDTRTTTDASGRTTTTTQPIYGLVSHSRTKYSYEIQEWVESRELQAQGEERATLHWPTYQLDRRTHERMQKTQEKYLVFFQTIKGKTYKRALSEADWAALDDTCTVYRPWQGGGYLAS
ncbi:MAG TPA: hypothetical protein VKR06_17240 [Ktedonosporobacter sp.]|nr:hypothetical protein [Ktedonosporobacter sp.]